MLYESKVKCARVQEQDGTVKMVTEVYMVDALSFAEAEARITGEVEPCCNGEFDVVALKRSNIKELCKSQADGDDKWFNCKLEMLTIDEQAGKEKKCNYNILVQASNIEEAKRYLEKHMQGTMADWELKSITETKILEVYASNGSNN